MYARLCRKIYKNAGTVVPKNVYKLLQKGGHGRA